MLIDDVLHSEILWTLKMVVTLCCKVNMFLDNIPVFVSSDLLILSILILVMIDLIVYSISSWLETRIRTFLR